MAKKRGVTRLEKDIDELMKKLSKLRDQYNCMHPQERHEVLFESIGLIRKIGFETRRKLDDNFRLRNKLERFRKQGNVLQSKQR